MATDYVSLGYYYFSKLGGSPVYAPIDPRPLPIFRNSEISTIINDTLPGISQGSVTSGRSIYIPMGGAYRPLIPSMEFVYTTETFISFLEEVRDEMNDFVFGCKVGIDTELNKIILSKYRVNFISNGLNISQNYNPTPMVKVDLINLGYIGTVKVNVF